MENMKEKECMGECPYCGGEDVEYDAFVKDDEGGHYPGMCNECGKHFQETYNLEYAITYYDGDADAVEDNRKTITSVETKYENAKNEAADARDAHDATRAELVAVRGTLAGLVAAAPDVVEALGEAADHIKRNADSAPAGILVVDEMIYANQIITRGDKLQAAVEQAQQVL